MSHPNPQAEYGENEIGTKVEAISFEEDLVKRFPGTTIEKIDSSTTVLKIPAKYASPFFIPKEKEN